MTVRNRSIGSAHLSQDVYVRAYMTSETISLNYHTSTHVHLWILALTGKYVTATSGVSGKAVSHAFSPRRHSRTVRRRACLSNGIMGHVR